MTLFAASAPGEGFSRLQCGDLSTDRVSIVGRDDMLFLYEGSNDHFRTYSHDMAETLTQKGQDWANLTAQRHATFAPKVQMLSLFVPNAASCLPDLYPMPLQQCPSPAWSEMKYLVGGDPGVMFCDELFEASIPATRFDASPWRLVDSHWSEFGALIVVNSILKRLGIERIESTTVCIDPIETYGDLGSRFGDFLVTEYLSRKLEFELPDPKCVYDAGDGMPAGSVMGRRIEWNCPSAPVPLSIAVIGNSFAGVGTLRTHLVYWLSRTFQRTVFLHSGELPTDVLESYQPDVLLFQGVERFLGLVPEGIYTVQQIEAIYTGT